MKEKFVLGTFSILTLVSLICSWICIIVGAYWGFLTYGWFAILAVPIFFAFLPFNAGEIIFAYLMAKQNSYLFYWFILPLALNVVVSVGTSLSIFIGKYIEERRSSNEN